MISLEEQYIKKGYVIIKNVFDENEIDKIRSYILKTFDLQNNSNLRMVYGSEIIKDQTLYSVFFRKKIINSLKIIFGDDFEYIPDFIIQINSFGQKEKKYKPGWHVDSASEGPAKYFLKKDYKFAKMGIYLQDNSKEYGGGINLTPGGHRIYLKFLPVRIVFFIKKLKDKLNIIFNNHFIKSKPGDIIIFDSRLPHASSLPKIDNQFIVQNKNEINKIDGLGNNSKFVFYCNVCSSKESPDFMKHSFKRSLNEKTPFFDYSKQKYPDDYDKDFVKFIEDNKIKIAKI